jgi:hypothetical protein
MKIYEIYSLVVGGSALITLTGFMIGSVFLKNFLFCLDEPRLLIAIIEMIMGLTAIPYYLKKFIGK